MPYPRYFAPARTALASLCLALCLGAPLSSRADPVSAERFYQDARTRIDKDDLEGALIQLKNAVQQDGSMLAARLLFGQTLFKLGQLKDAEIALTEAERLGVNRSETVLLLAQIYLLLGDSQRVVDKVQATRFPGPLQAEVLTVRGLAYANLASSSASQRAFADARAADPSSPAPWIAESSVLLRGGRVAEAKASAAKATGLAPNSSLAWSALAAAALAGNEVADALAGYDKALRLDAKNREARVARAALYLRMSRYDEARADLGVLVQSGRALDDPRVPYLQAELASVSGDAVAAKDTLKASADLVDALPRGYVKGRNDLLITAALAHYGLRNWEKSREYLGILLAVAPRNVVARKLLASLALETKDYAQAASVLERLNIDLPSDPQVQFMLGSAYLGQRRFEPAAALLEKAAGAGQTQALRELGLSQLALGRDSAGLATLQKSFAARPKDSGLGFELALAYFQRGQARRALELAQDIAKANPRSTVALNFLGALKLRSGDLAGAKAEFQRALAVDPAFKPSGVNLVQILAQERQYPQARVLLSQLVSSHTEDTDLVYEQGVLEMKAGDVTLAMRYFQRASEQQRGDPRAGIALINLLQSQGEADKARAAARQMETNFPGNLAVKLALGRFYAQRNETALARELLLSASNMAGPDAEAQNQIARLQLSTSNPEGALASAELSLKAVPGNEAAMVMVVEANALRGAQAAADQAMKALADRYPGSPSALLTAANLAMARGQYPAAASGYAATLAKAPTTATVISLARAHLAAGEGRRATQALADWVKGHPRDAAVWKALAELQANAGDTSAARGSYEKALALEPDEPLALNNLAGLQLRLNDPKALDTAEKAYKLAPRSPEVADTLGWVLVRRGQLERGLALLREARLRSPDNGEVRYHLAYALAKFGRKAEAKDELVAALGLLKDLSGFEELPQLRRELGV